MGLNLTDVQYRRPYFRAKSFSNSSFDSFSPSSDSHTDLFFVAGLEM